MNIKIILLYTLLFTGGVVLNYFSIGGLLSGLLIIGATGGIFHLGLVSFFNGMPSFMGGLGQEKTPAEPDYTRPDGYKK